MITEKVIKDDFLVLNAKGLYCKYGDFYIDPKEPAGKALISHAHADHAISGNGEVYCTEATWLFMQLRYGKSAGKVIHKTDFSIPFNLGGVVITFYPAGHMLGSAQVMMEYGGVEYLYTGDYKLQPDETCEPIEFVKTDVLITESTFANPETHHPDAGAEIVKLNNYSINILLGAYGMGKSQRLIKLINTYIPEKKVLVHHRIAQLNNIYARMGFPAGDYELYNRKLMKNQYGYIYIVPPFTFNSYIRAANVKRFFASGWENLQVNKQDTLFISDHADWNDILETIRQTSPQEIWTIHGNGLHLKQYFEGLIPVKVLN